MPSETTVNHDPLARLPSVLIVEDEFIQRLALVDYLEENGLNAVAAITADDALDMLRSARVPVDIVVTDVQTPGKLDGFMLVRWVRANYPHLPVIVVSGHPEIRRSEARVGEAFFPKPYDDRLLLAKIRQMLGRDTGMQDGK
jgi:CheY-like chemotaxis protein